MQSKIPLFFFVLAKYYKNTVASLVKVLKKQKKATQNAGGLLLGGVSTTQVVGNLHLPPKNDFVFFFASRHRLRRRTVRGTVYSFFFVPDHPPLPSFPPPKWKQTS